MRKRLADRWLAALGLVVLVAALAGLAALLWEVIRDGAPRLSWSFLTGFPSRRAEEAGLYPALVGSVLVVSVAALSALPLGVAAAIYLEEYAPRGRASQFIETNIANLAGVPSIVYGLLGLSLFVRGLGLGRSLLAGAATLALLILPVVITASREALRGVPSSLREASYALGATRWQTIWHQVLPLALPGMLTGIILAVSRALGETAPLITIGALTYVPFAPDSLWSPFTALPVQIFNWISRPQPAFHQNAAAAILVLLGVLVLLNGTAIWLRDRFGTRWQP
jgi:phosphate transport system permease protein